MVRRVCCWDCSATKSTASHSAAQRSQSFPGFAFDASLAQNTCEQVAPDVAPMRIGNGHTELLADHKLMTLAGVGAVERKLPEVVDQIRALDRPDGTHQVASR